jgi:molybdopterin synthase sulfur carrier subunit
MRVKVKFFASLREVLKTSEELLDLPDHIQTIGQLRQYLVARGEPWSQALADGRAVRVAINHDMVDLEMALLDNAEVAFFPPVTGG